MSDSESIKNALVKQVLQEANLANARVLIEVRFARPTHSPGSLS